MMTKRSITDIRREEIIEAFYSTVAQKGFGKATIREIASRAGCSYGVLNYHFENKEELVLSFLDHVMTTYSAELLDGVSKCDTATERLEFVFSYFSDLTRFTLDFCRVWVECWAVGNSNRRVSERLNKCYDDLKKVLDNIIREGIRSGEFKKVNPTIASNLIQATCEGLTMLWVVNTENTPVESVNKHLPEFCLSYLKRQI